jgi:hypothetical protein
MSSLLLEFQTEIANFAMVEFQGERNPAYSIFISTQARIANESNYQINTDTGKHKKAR